MPSHPDDTNPGLFLGTTQIYDLGRSSVDAEDFSVRLRDNLNNIVMALNIKDSGYYAQEEFVNGQLFYPDYSDNTSTSSASASFRPVFRKVIDIGALPNIAGSPKKVAHNITWPVLGVVSLLTGTRIYGCATNPTTQVMIPIPFVNVGGHIIEVTVDATNVNISVNDNGYTGYTICRVVLEYLKS